MWVTLHRCCACAAAGVGTSCSLCLFYKSPWNAWSPPEDVIEASHFLWTERGSAASRETVPTSPHACLWLIWLFSENLGELGDTWPGDGSWSRTCDLSVKRSPEPGASARHNGFMEKGSEGTSLLQRIYASGDHKTESDPMASIWHFVQLAMFIISVWCPVISI